MFKNNSKIILIINVLLSLLYVVYALYYKYQVDNNYVFIHHNPSILNFPLDYIYARYFILICAAQVLIMGIAAIFYNYKLPPVFLGVLIPLVLGSWGYLMATPGNILYKDVYWYWLTLGVINVGIGILILFLAKQKDSFKEASVIDDDF